MAFTMRKSVWTADIAVRKNAVSVYPMRMTVEKTAVMVRDIAGAAIWKNWAQSLAAKI